MDDFPGSQSSNDYSNGMMGQMQLQIQQQAIDRNRKLAELMQQQGMTPDNGQMISGHYVPPSNVGYLAKIAQTLIGGANQRDLDQQQLGIAKNYDAGTQRLIRALTGQDDTAGATQPAGSATSSAAGTLPAAGMGGEVFAKAASEAGLGSDTGTLNRIVALVNQGMSPQQAAQSVKAGGAQSNQSGVQAPAVARSNAPLAGMNPALIQLAANSPGGVQNITKMALDLQMKNAEQTPDMKNLAVAYGVNSPQYKQAMQDLAFKLTNVPDESFRPGGYGVNKKTGVVTQYPQIPEGMQGVSDGNGGFKAVDVPGVLQGITNQSVAKAAGPATFEDKQVWDATANNGKGGYVYQSALNRASANGSYPGGTQPAPVPAPGTQAPGVTPNFLQAVVSTESGGNPNAVSPKGATGLLQTMPGTLQNPGFGVTPARDNSPAEQQRVGTDYLNAMHGKYGDKTLAAIAYNMGPAATDKWLADGGDFNRLPAETRNYVASVNTKEAVLNRQNPQQQPSNTQPPQRSPMAASAPLGAEAGANTGAANKLNVMRDDYSVLSGQNANAQTTISRLNTIKELGSKAITGGETEKRDFYNTLLSLAGMKSATDSKTASDLIDKNAAQIATSIGMGPNGSDALRTMLSAAYPNRHMTLDAMNQAVDALAPSLQMTQAKAALLTPHFNRDDAVSYQEKKQIFDTNADPKIWQYKNLGPGTPQGKAFMRAAIKSDPAFLNKITQLDAIGALK